jgi:Ca2+-binding EF-hand superfamily protein
MLDTTSEQALDLDLEQQDRAVHAFHSADINGDGELDLGEFKQILGTLGISIPKKQFEAYADAFFADLDVDGSRTLDLEVCLS